jgi:hypothetical protein
LNTSEVIVSIAAEGGSITLYGAKDSNSAWRFARSVNDQAPTFLNEEDGGGPAINHQSTWVTTWPEAIALLDRYPWVMLGAQQVHPEFRERVWAEVTQRLQEKSGPQAERGRERWARACHVSGHDVFAPAPE